MKLAEAVGPAWIAFVDVVDAPDLRLVLPTRNEAIENDFLRALRGRAERAILECVALQPSHALAFKDAQRHRPAAGPHRTGRLGDAERRAGTPLPQAAVRAR